MAANSSILQSAQPDDPWCNKVLRQDWRGCQTLCVLDLFLGHVLLDRWELCLTCASWGSRRHESLRGILSSDKSNRGQIRNCCTRQPSCSVILHSSALFSTHLGLIKQAILSSLVFSLWCRWNIEQFVFLWGIVEDHSIMRFPPPFISFYWKSCMIY